MSPMGSESSSASEFMLFGVRVKVDPMRKSVSMNNLSDYEPINNGNENKNESLVVAPEGGGNAAAGYASAEDAVPKCSRERKRGTPWTEEEHKLFLIGLQKVGRGDWRGISRNYVKTRTPTQVASHAQKYFLRQSNIHRRRRRSSLFDMTTDSVTAVEGSNNNENNPAQPVSQPIASGYSVIPFSVNPVLFPMQSGNIMEDSVKNIDSAAVNVHPILFVPIPTSSATMVDLNLNQNMPMDSSCAPLSLQISLSSGHDLTSTRDLIFGKGDSSISVA